MRSVTGKEFIAKLVPVPVPVHRAAAALGKRLVLTLE